jgi:hypothetical protein
MEFENSSYAEGSEFDWIMRSAEQARRLGRLLLQAAGFDHRIVARSVPNSSADAANA